MSLGTEVALTGFIRFLKRKPLFFATICFAVGILFSLIAIIPRDDKSRFIEIINQSPEVLFAFYSFILGISGLFLALRGSVSYRKDIDVHSAYVENINKRLTQLVDDSNGKPDSAGKSDFYRKEYQKLQRKYNALNRSIFDSAPEVFAASRIGLLNETNRLVSVSNKNLGIGIIFSLISFAMMFYVAYNNQSLVLYSIIYRISLVLLIQFVGFFFLRLYVSNELDIKQNKNELTNIEMKYCASLLSDRNESDKHTTVIKHLIEQERNFVVKDGFRPISHGNSAEFNDIAEIVKSFIDKIPSASK